MKYELCLIVFKEILFPVGYRISLCVKDFSHIMRNTNYIENCYPAEAMCFGRVPYVVDGDTQCAYCLASSRMAMALSSTVVSSMQTSPPSGPGSI